MFPPLVLISLLLRIFFFLRVQAKRNSTGYNKLNFSVSRRARGRARGGDDKNNPHIIFSEVRENKEEEEEEDSDDGI